MNRISGFLLLLGAVACSSPRTIHLHGQLKDMGRQEVIMRFNGAASLIGDSRDIILHTDAEGRFDTILPWSEPEYYSISRNTLWLTPGDDLEVYITQDNQEAQFKGKGAEANIYLKERLFPKGGSFLVSGANIKGDFAQTAGIVRELAAERQKQLEALEGVSAGFKQLEKARIYADVINSYLSYSSYAPIVLKQEDTRENRLAQERANLESVMPEMQEKVKCLNDERFLDVAVVRDVLFYQQDSAYAAVFEAYKPGERTRELYKSYRKVSALRRKLNHKMVDDNRNYIAGMKQADFVAELEAKVNQAARLLPGQPAPDFIMTDTAGNQKRLSDFKGNPIYMDLWATWCGPCIEESPAFVELSGKYPDILFLQISRDEQKAAWLNYLSYREHTLPQYNSVDLALVEEWQIFSIPRFILIDKDQKIIDAYAPRPSSPEIVKVLDKLID